jgi:hypothetical protein
MKKILKLEYIKDSITAVVNEPMSNNDPVIKNESDSYNAYAKGFYNNLFDLIRTPTSEFAKRVMTHVEMAETLHLSFIPTPGESLISKKVAFFTAQAESATDPAVKERFTKLSKQATILRKFTQTACATECIRMKDRALVDAVTISQDIHNMIEKTHGAGSDKYKAALVALVAHELLMIDLMEHSEFILAPRIEGW